ncbi:MAG: hypothetical protein EXS08_09845 [Planctomycetes bacterium]|nr:hypothetical protein [Planctomycetota bacterium]
MHTKQVLVASPGPGFSALLYPPVRLVLGFVGGLTLAAGAAHAQLEPIYQSGNFIPSPPNLTGLYHGIVSGDLNGDLSPEVAVIKGTKLIVYPNADVGNDSIVVASDAIDVCYSPDAAGLGHPGLLYTTASGLKRLTVAPGVPVEPGVPVPDVYSVQLISSSPLWLGAPLIRSSAGVGQGPGQGLIGVKSDERTFFSAYSAGSGFELPATIFSLNSTLYARDIVLLDWNGLPDGKKEIGIRHSNGIQIRDQAGAYLLARNAITPGDAIAVVAKPGLTDSFAWVTRFADGTSNLLLFNQGFPGLYQPPQSLSSRVFDSMASGDLLGDGDGDLVFGAVSWSTLQIRESDSSAATWFSPTPSQELDLRIDGGMAAVPIGKVLCANIFNDWIGSTPIPSFAAVLPNSDGLRLVPNLSGRYALVGPSVDFSSTKIVYPAVNPCTASNGKWEMTLGNGWGTTTATHIQVVVRMKNSSASSVRPAALRHLVFALNGAAINGKLLSFELDYGPPAPSVVNDVYFAMVRPIQLPSSNATSLSVINQAWRWSILGLPMDLPGDVFLRAQAGFGDTVGCSEEFCPPPPSNLGGRYIPSPVLQSHIPSSGPGTLPSIPGAIFL